MRFRVACLTFSNHTLPLLQERLGEAYEIVRESVLEYDISALQAELIDVCDRAMADLIVTCGGIGLSHNDRTPQATAAVVDFEIPGIAEAIRAAALRNNASAMFSRVFAGVRHKTLIVNLPGNSKALAEALDTIAAVLPSALETILQ